eukprot:751478-Hanusia_phi.AAC.1
MRQSKLTSQPSWCGRLDEEEKHQLTLSPQAPPLPGRRHSRQDRQTPRCRRAINLHEGSVRPPSRPHASPTRRTSQARSRR